MAFITKVGPPSLPAAGDSVRVYETGTTVLVDGLLDLDGAPLVNPVVVPESGFWGFEPPDYEKVDIYWDEGGQLLLEKAVLRDSGINIGDQRAADTPYDNTFSGLTSTNVQAAIDELKELYDSLTGSS